MNELGSLTTLAGWKTRHAYKQTRDPLRASVLSRVHIRVDGGVARTLVRCPADGSDLKLPQAAEEC